MRYHRRMALTGAAAIELATQLRVDTENDRHRLDEVRRYWVGRQRLPAVIPATAPREVRQMARMARVNVAGLVVESLAQSLAVEGYRAAREADNTAVWGLWQANRLDARQDALHRAAVAYGVAYAVVTPGEPSPVIRYVSPRRLIAMYHEDKPDWPVCALERRLDTWRLYDSTDVHRLTWTGAAFEHLGALPHGAGVTPVVRFMEVADPDWDDEVSDESYASPDDPGSRAVIGQIAPLMALQDQIDLITFNLLVAQHYTAFRQRFIIGWVAPDEATRMKMGASQVWTFEDAPGEVQLGEFSQTDLTGYLKSREASFRQAASLSQTPAHELIGEMVNLSAEALAAAEAGRDRKVAARQTALGEGHEQTLALAGKLAGIDVPPDAQVVWRDTGARSFAAVVDALGKLTALLGVPAQELWERVPGVSQQDVERWRARAATGDALVNLAAILERQAAG